MDIVIFGISGDLAHKKLLPALESLSSKGKLPKDTRIIGYSRSVKDIETSFEYKHVAGGYDSLESFSTLKDELRADKPHLFYLSVPPTAYRDILTTLHKTELVTKDDPTGFRTILVEKPFGLDYADAESLLSLTKELFRDDQCLKIDHYSGKKDLRDLEEEHFDDLKEVTFSIKETILVGERTGFYDSIGALRDVGQNHILFMLSTFFKGDEKREDILQLLQPEEDTSKYVYAHYEGYDAIETYFSVPAHLNDERFEDISLMLVGGKGLDEAKVSINIVYKSGETKEIIIHSGTEAYENIFMDGIEGKHSSFLSEKEILAAWKFIEEAEKVKKTTGIGSYPVGGQPGIV